MIAVPIPGRQKHTATLLGESLRGETFAKPMAQDLTGLAAFLSSDLHLEPMIANLPGTASMHWHESRPLVILVGAIHGLSTVLVFEATGVTKTRIANAVPEIHVPKTGIQPPVARSETRYSISEVNSSTDSPAASPGGIIELGRWVSSPTSARLTLLT